MNRSRFRLHAGTASILLVFVTLCLISFAVLTLVNANADMRLSERIAERTTAYYGAVSDAERFIAETDEQSYPLWEESADEADFIRRFTEAFGAGALSCAYPLNDTQSLRVTLTPRYPGSEAQKKSAVPDENRYGGNPLCVYVAEFVIVTDEDAFPFEEEYLNLPH